MQDYNIGTGDFTIETKIYIHDKANTSTFIAKSKYSGVPNRWTLLLAGGGDLKFSLVDGTNTSNIAVFYSNADIPIDTWMKLKVTIDQTNEKIKVYVDGILKDTVSFTSGDITSIYEFALFQYQNSSGINDGTKFLLQSGNKVSYVKIWKTLDTSTTPLSYWDFEATTIDGEDGSITIPDRGSNEAHLTIVSGTLSMNLQRTNTLVNPLNEEGYNIYDVTDFSTPVQPPLDPAKTYVPVGASIANSSVDAFGNTILFKSKTRYPAIVKDAHVATGDGTATIRFSTGFLTGKTITSYEGDATLTINGDDIEISSGGKVWNLELSDGSFYPLTGKDNQPSDTIYDISGNNNHAAWANSTRSVRYSGVTNHPSAFYHLLKGFEEKKNLNLSNLDFETGDFSDWSITTGVSITGDSHSGSYAAKLDYTSAITSELKKTDYTFTGGVTYLFKLWYKIDGGAGNRFRLILDDKVKYLVCNTPDEWEYTEFELTPTNSNQMRFYGYNGGIIAYVDDIEVYEMGNEITATKDGYIPGTTTPVSNPAGTRHNGTDNAIFDFNPGDVKELTDSYDAGVNGVGIDD
jgi:hypothetical protein